MINRFRDLTVAAVIGIATIVTAIDCADAALLSVNDSVFGANSVTLDTNTGLEWLDVDRSIGRAAIDVSSQFGVGGDFEGWRYADRSEVHTLFVNGNVRTGIERNGSEVINFSAAHAFMDLLSTTIEIGITRSLHGLFDSTALIPGTVGFAQISATTTPNTGTISSIFGTGLPLSFFTSDFGSLLVRASDPQQGGDVPEPAALTLVAGGLLGFGMLHRRRKARP